MLRRVAASTGARLLNLNLELSRRMLELTGRERSFRLPDLLDEVVGRDAPLVLLDNIELLFDLAFQHDPLRLLQGVSRNRTIVATWNGTLADGYLSYAVPDHPEFRPVLPDGTRRRGRRLPGRPWLTPEGLGRGSRQVAAGAEKGRRWISQLVR